MPIVTFIRNHPLLRITFIYIAGIYITAICPSVKTLLIISIIAGFVAFCIHWMFQCKIPSLGFIPLGSLIYLLFMIAGIINYWQNSRHTEFPAGMIHYSAIVADQPIIKEKSIQLDCRINSIGNLKQRNNQIEKVRLYFEKDSNNLFPNVGDSVIFYGKLDKIRNAGNPGEFDYARYMEYQGIWYTGFINKANFRLGSNSGKLKLKRFSTHIQQQLIKNFTKYNIQNDELAVLSALAAGNRNYLEEELRESYAAAGAIHVLAVSGLHVGILYLILTLIFGRRNQRKYFRLFRVIVILCIIWLYALITGLSSSVLRAAFMFTLFLIGKNLNRQIDNYNMLFASALLILIIYPFELFKVGFQFSYLAVLGILYFQPKLQNILLFRNGIIDRIWQLFTVSIAAQLTTFPLSIYYFHQFPVYFWLTNMLVIPIVWLIMAGAILFGILTPFSFILPAIAFFLKVLLTLLNYTIRLIEDLPFSTIADIRFNTAYVIVFYAIIFLFIGLISAKHFRYILHLFCLMLIFITAEDFISIRKANNEKKVVVYNTRNNTLVLSIIDGLNHTAVTKGPESSDNDVQYFKDYWISERIERNMNWIRIDTMNHNWIFRGKNLTIKVMSHKLYIDFYDKSILYMPDWWNNHYRLPDNSKERIVVIDNSSGFPGTEFFNELRPDLICATKSLNPKKSDSWKKLANNYRIYFHDIRNQGALSVILQTSRDSFIQEKLSH